MYSNNDIDIAINEEELCLEIPVDVEYVSWNRPFTAADEGKVVHNDELVEQTERSVTVNGTYDTTLNDSTVVNVPNTYADADEGKVVQNHALVSQTGKTVTSNDTYDTTTNNSVVVNVPNTYAAGDEGKVVQNSALVSQTSKSISANGTYDTTTNNSAVVNVPNTYTAADEGKVVESGALVSQGTLNVSSNGTYDTTKKNSTVVAVPNTYTASDEGKVVDNGALVSQGTLNVTSNGTYDTTKKNSTSVNVPNTYTQSDEGKVVQSGVLVAQSSQTVTQNGTYDTTVKNEMVVDVSGGGGVTLLTVSQWDALTTAQKRTYGIVAIETSDSGYLRGDLVNGADYFQALYTGTVGNGGTVTRNVTLNAGAKIIVIAINSEASTKDLNVNASLDGVALTATTLEFHSYTSSGSNKRNYRIVEFDVETAGSYSLQIAFAQSYSHSSLIYVVFDEFEYSLDYCLTTADGPTAGSNAESGCVLYGTSNDANGGTISTELYRANTQINTASPGSSYKSSYIFWFA